MRKCSWNFSDVRQPEMAIIAANFFHRYFSRDSCTTHTSFSNVSLSARQSDCYSGKDTPYFWLIVCLVLCICPAGMCFPWFYVAMVCLYAFPVCFCLFLAIYQSIFLSFCRSIVLSIYLSVCPSVFLSVHPSVCHSSVLSIYLSVCLSIVRSFNHSIYLSSIYLSVCLSI